jgi:hypothetical protein
MGAELETKLTEFFGALTGLITAITKNNSPNISAENQPQNADETPTEQKRGRGRPPKSAAPATDPLAAPVVAESAPATDQIAAANAKAADAPTTPGEVAAAVAQVGAVTMEQTKAVLQELMKSGDAGRKTTLDLLSRCGVTQLTQVSGDQLAYLYAEGKKALGQSAAPAATEFDPLA